MTEPLWKSRARCLLASRLLGDPAELIRLPRPLLAFYLTEASHALQYYAGREIAASPQANLSQWLDTHQTKYSLRCWEVAEAIGYGKSRNQLRLVRLGQGGPKARRLAEEYREFCEKPGGIDRVMRNIEKLREKRRVSQLILRSLGKDATRTLRTLAQEED